MHYKPNFIFEVDDNKILKIDEFVSSLPSGVLSGDEIVIPEDFFRKIFHFCNLNSKDVFYYLGIGYNFRSLLIAKEEFNVKVAVGIDIESHIIDSIKPKVSSTNHVVLRNEDVLETSLSEATVVFSWFIDDRINSLLVKKYESDLQDGSRVISIWSPPSLFMPNKVDFPLILCEKPFNKGNNIQEQLQSIYGTKCIDFTAAWNLAQRYVTSIQSVDNQFIRFLNMLYSVIIWFNARDMGLACETDIPPPVKSYVGILQYFFNIDLKELL